MTSEEHRQIVAAAKRLAREECIKVVRDLLNACRRDAPLVKHPDGPAAAYYMGAAYESAIHAIRELKE